jgi:hypothetical protein
MAEEILAGEEFYEYIHGRKMRVPIHLSSACACGAECHRCVGKLMIQGTTYSCDCTCHNIKTHDDLCDRRLL